MPGLREPKDGLQTVQGLAAVGEAFITKHDRMDFTGLALYFAILTFIFSVLVFCQAILSYYVRGEGGRACVVVRVPL